ncbi:PSP1 domain protein [Desulfatibacillum aliphaticivorans]|uniref:PSP1 domain protein n=1 Tax=Desulfatibacillum aliphaticivorans TaxID=218208 RepID=B8FKC0_DESAL|nr:stage 0 sporulation family protein [Desulfatibacillum aliphaticivorans]ACL01735.1 PSP1 domain protein [Desulfatibacillum aliphaticivorans]
MGKVVGIRFKPQGKTYDFDPGVYVLAKGDKVVVETEQGLGFGTVATTARQVSEEMLKLPLKKIHRIATQEDLDQYESVLLLEKDAFDYCEKAIGELKLEMNLFSVDASFDSSKLTFFFTADGRVDFRELVKTLVRHFRVRIELRQIGVRHQAKMCGGLGRCGRETCCTSFMSGFVPVSVKMAKVQNLSLNPTKISGLCGRLMCCLTFEHEIYKELKDGFPKLGKRVNTPSGKGKVIRHNLLKGLVSVRLEEGAEIELPADHCAPPDEPAPKIAAPAPEENDQRPSMAEEAQADQRPDRPEKKRRPRRKKKPRQTKGNQDQDQSKEDKPKQKQGNPNQKQGKGKPRRPRNKKRNRQNPDKKNTANADQPAPKNNTGGDS